MLGLTYTSCCCWVAWVVSDSLWPSWLNCRAPLSMGLSKQEHWSGLPFPSPGDLPDRGIKPTSFTCLVLAGRFFTTGATWEAFIYTLLHVKSWRREWQSTPVLFPGESHRRRSLAGYSPWGRKESDMTERLTHTHTHTRRINNSQTVYCIGNST